MKTPVAVTLIVAGALLILAPLVFNALHESQLLAVYAARTDLTSIKLGDSNALNPFSRFGCWFVGALMILTATFMSRHSQTANGAGASDVPSSRATD